MLNTQLALEELGEDIVKFARINIGRKRRVQSLVGGKFYTTKINSTGTLRDSLDYAVKASDNDNLTLKIEAVDYAEDVDKGQKKGTIVNTNSLEHWIKNKPVRLRDSDGKFIQMNAKNIRNFAGFVAWKIKTFGTQPTEFLTDAIDKALDENEDNIIENVEGDLTIQIRNILIKLNTET